MVLVLEVLAVLLLSTVLLLALPLTLYFSFSWPQMSDNVIRISWIFGLVKVRLPISASIPKPSTGLKVEACNRRQSRVQLNAKQTTAGDHQSDSRSWTQLRRLGPTFFRFFRRCRRSIGLRDIRVLLRLGMGDPADTGMLMGALAPLAAGLSHSGRFSFAVVPDFSESVVEIQSSGNIRFVPLQIMVLILAFLLTPAVWRAIR